MQSNMRMVHPAIVESTPPVPKENAIRKQFVAAQREVEIARLELDASRTYHRPEQPDSTCRPKHASRGRVENVTPFSSPLDPPTACDQDDEPSDSTFLEEPESTNPVLTFYEEEFRRHKDRHGGTPHSDMARFLYQVGGARYESGDVHHGLDYFKQALLLQQTIYGRKQEPHWDLAMSLQSVGQGYQELGEISRGLVYCERAVDMKMALLQQGLDTENKCRLEDVTISLVTLGEGYNKRGCWMKAKHVFELAQKFMPVHLNGSILEFRIQHHLARCCHALGVYTATSSEGSQQTYFQQAKTAFERAMAVPVCGKEVALGLSGVLVDYATFLISSGREFRQAYGHLIRVVESGDEESGLVLRLDSTTAVAPGHLQFLKEQLEKHESQPQELRITAHFRALDFAFFLLIHHYTAFQKSGIQLKLSRTAYLQDYERGIEARSGRPGKEQHDANSRLLMESLQRKPWAQAWQGILARIPWGRNRNEPS